MSPPLERLLYPENRRHVQQTRALKVENPQSPKMTSRWGVTLSERAESLTEPGIARATFRSLMGATGFVGPARREHTNTVPSNVLLTNSAEK